MLIIKKAMRVALERLKLLSFVKQIQRDLFTWWQNRLKPEEIEAIYKAQYHECAGYGKSSGEIDSSWEPDDIIKLSHARAITEVLPTIKKVLVGGCSSGTGVLAFKNIGVEAYGFEISPDLDRIVLPEVRSFIRHGSMTSIPFSVSDGFDCLITTDVLEHLQLKEISQMVEIVGSLKIQWMAHLINHTAMTPDHMTLKPLKWWAEKFSPYYRLRSNLHAKESGNSRIYGLNGDPLHVYTFWERI